MVNCNVFTLLTLGSETMLMQIACQYGFGRPGPGDEYLDQAMLERAEGWLCVAEGAARDFEMDAVHHRIEVMRKLMERDRVRAVDLATEMRVLRETFDFCLRDQLVFRYPDNEAATLKRWLDDWQPVREAFPASVVDIRSGVDLWALGHGTAAVFHFMRVLEHGLKALAADVGRSFDLQNWQNIIEQIEASITSERKAAPAGSGKVERVDFLSRAAKEFMFFKDGWRNHVSHNRKSYTPADAGMVMVHVRQFMTVLAEKLRET